MLSFLKRLFRIGFENKTEKGKRKYYNKKTAEKIEADLQAHPRRIRYVQNPPDDLCIRLLTRDPSLWVMLQRITPAVAEAIVANNPYAIMSLPQESQTEKCKLIAVSANGRAIQYIANPSEEVQRAAVVNCLNAYRLIKNPAPSVTDLYNSKKPTIKVKSRAKDKLDAFKGK